MPNIAVNQHGGALTCDLSTRDLKAGVRVQVHIAINTFKVQGLPRIHDTLFLKYRGT